ncbi:tail fiber domain-containing protein, partial [Candidatus Daviesbacteria bacterium]|nr:tail fiber domain-containing protein [Candidatus Daviesbacteria bacterium]
TPIVGGNITTQRVAYIKQPTFTGTVSERTITNSYGLFVDPATAGSLMAITNTYGIGAGASTTIAGAASSTYASLFVPAHTVTTNTTTQITSSPAVAGLSIAQITVAQSGGAVTVDNAASLYIANAPTAGASVTLTNPYALWVDAGTSAFGGNIVPDTSDGAALGTTALMWSDLFLASGSVINFNNGDVTLTHSTDTLTLAGGVFAAPLGSATAPPYTFTGDPNTGIYSSTADTVDITAAGNRVMKFASSGGNPIVPYYNIALASTSVYLTSASGHGRLTMGENGGAYAALITSQENTTHSSMLQIDPQGVDVGTDPSNLGAEMKWLELNSRTITFSANVTNQRQAHIEAATYAGSAATKTITNAYGLFVEPPITSTNAVITNTYGIGAGASTTIAGAASSTYASLFVPAHTVTTNTTTQITSSPAVAGVSIGQITVAQSGGAVTVDNAASLYIANAPTNGASVTLTNPYALWVDAGNVRFDGDIIGYDETTSANTNVITATAGGETVFNDASEDINFRIESDGDANMLHVDGGNNSIGFGRTGGATNFIALRPGNATRTAANVEGAVLYLEQDTQNFNNASSTINAQAAMSLRTQTWTNDNATLTFTNAATLYIEAAPVASTNVAISNPYALWVDAGTTRLDGTLQLGIAGATTGVMNFQGSTSGVVTLQAAATAGTYTLTLPTAQAGVNQFLKNDGSGNLSWDTSPLTLNSITAAGATNTIANANYAQTWNWGTLTTQTGMTFGGGTAMTTGSIFDLGGATYVHTAAETGELMNLTFTDASTNTTGNSITQGLNIASTINTSGAGTKNINAINIATPTKTACTSGACTWTGLAIADPGTLANTTFYAATFAGGNVGIGTTAPVAKLQVTGISSAPATSGTTTNANIRMRGAGTGLLDMGNISGGNVYLQVTDAADLSLGYNLLLNPNAGNVGIGTASPTNKLTIAGEAGIDFIESSGAYNFFALDFNNEDRTGVAFSGNDTTSAALSISSKNEMYFDIERGGAVAGIQSYIFRSNNTATTLLTIKDDGTVDVPNNIQLGDNGATSAIKVGTFGHIISRNATDGALDIGNGQATVNIGRTSANNLVVYGSGTTCTIGSGTGATNCTSDERLKTNIEAISGADALAKLSLINGVTFNWADPSRPQEQQVGIIAQDVMQAFPQIVKTGETRFMGQMGTYYTVDYAALVSPLIAGVNELNSRVNSILNDKVYDSADASLEAGDVVTVDKEASSSAYIAKSSKPYQNDLIGIVSTKPGFKLSQEDGVLENPRMVALAGRTPVKVSGEAGPIEIGDYLTSSSTPGVAMKATRPGQVVGKALEPFDSAQGGSVGKILAFVNISFADPQQALANLLLDEEGNLVIPKVKTASLEIGPIGPISQISPIGQSQEQENALDVASKLKVIDEQIATQSAYLAKAQEEIASASSELAKAKSDIDLLKLTPPEILLATGSATLANIKATETLSSEKLLTALDVTVSGVFKALGEAILPKTIVAGGLVVDGTFSVDNGSEINAIPTLYIQKNALASSLDILAGKFIFDKDGKLTVAGTVEAKQFAVSQGGAAGSGKILAGQTEVVVENEFVAENSLILITPEIPLSQTLAVTNKSNKTNTTNGKFTVKMSQPEAQDIGFSYLIIGQGQKVSSL